MSSDLQCRSKQHTRTRYRVWRRWHKGPWRKGVLFYGNLARVKQAAKEWILKGWDIKTESIKAGKFPK